jgi:hypothetical protein
VDGVEKKLLPPVNWRWVEEGDGYVRHEAWPHTPTGVEGTVLLIAVDLASSQLAGCRWSEWLGGGFSWAAISTQ